MATENTLTNQTNAGALLERILGEYASIPYAHGDLQAQTVFDHPRGRYLLLNLGWNGNKRVHGVIVDVELRGDKFWVHYDGTEQGIASDLERSGVPKDRIVLAWMPESYRQHSEYAVK